MSSQRPQTRIICATGEECDVPYFVLRKPFDLDDLPATLVTVLSQA